jgi:hypothetical protein
MKPNLASPKFLCISARGGLKPCLSSWKSGKPDSVSSPKGFHALSRRLQPRSGQAEESK